MSLPKEKGLMEAAEALFNGPGEKLARDLAYSAAMNRLYEQYPTDHEIAIFYALSLLGTVRPGDSGFRRQALAASIAEQVFRQNPNHPGAAHFIIHSFDDPDHAPLGLPAARAYAAIAPAAPHALHMPSHIFVQLGMWDDVKTSNIAVRSGGGVDQTFEPPGRPRGLSHALVARLRMRKCSVSSTRRKHRSNWRARPRSATVRTYACVMGTLDEGPLCHRKRALGKSPLPSPAAGQGGGDSHGMDHGYSGTPMRCSPRA